MAAFNKFRQFVEDIGKGVHILGTHQLVVALTATANAPVNTNTVLANLTQISYTNLSTRNVTTTSYTQTAGVGKLICVDLVLTASGAVAAFQYVALYNDTQTSPADPLIGWYDYGAAVTLANTETFTVDFDGAAGVFTIT